MKPGIASITASIVAIARAVAHGNTDVPRFSDPTAEVLLSGWARARLEASRRGPSPGGRARFAHVALLRRAKMMALRTVEIDDAIRAAPAPQVVILGAGLDGRAWRMPELAGSVVFEVDHPDTQASKRARVGSLERHAREVRFVPVDFRTSEADVRRAAASGEGGNPGGLNQRLDSAGHDPSVPTTWIWEGVIMYLEPRAVEETVAIISRRSTPGSRLVANYHSWSLVFSIVGLWFRRLGEPLRSSYSSRAMRELLARHGFEVIRDRNIHELAQELTPPTAREMRPMANMHIATAVRRPASECRAGVVPVRPSP